MLKEKSQESHFLFLSSDVSAPIIESLCISDLSPCNYHVQWVFLVHCACAFHRCASSFSSESSRNSLHAGTEERLCGRADVQPSAPPAGSFLYKSGRSVCVGVAVGYTVVSIFSMISIIDLDGESREQSSWSQRLPGLEFPSVLSSSSSSSLSSSQDSR